MPLVLSTLQVKTPDGSYKYIHRLVPSNPEKSLESWLRAINLTSMPGFNLAIFDDPNASCENPPYKYPGNDISKKVTCPLNQPDRLKLEALASQMASTGNIPDEFERRFFSISSLSEWY
jgi:hypothetical protein